MENKVLLGKMVRETRLSHNLTMDQVAKSANISRATLSAIENGSGNYSIDTLFDVMNALSMHLLLERKQKESTERIRASRINTARTKKINRFIIMCVEQFCAQTNSSTSQMYKELSNKGIIDELKNDYDDLHGMSTEYLNEYIGSRLGA